jgi:hypothetical protein
MFVSWLSSPPETVRRRVRAAIFQNRPPDPGRGSPLMFMYRNPHALSQVSETMSEKHREVCSALMKFASTVTSNKVKVLAQRDIALKK